MVAGGDLLGGAIEGPRKRGRPKGSTNKRAKDLRGLVDAKYGGSAVLQVAQVCLVTPAELKAAGGSMAKATVAKAAELVEHVRRAQADRDEDFRQVIRDEFERLLLDVREVTGKELRQAMDVALKRVREAGAGFTLREALDYLAQARRDVLPYTDQRQPLAVDVTERGRAPSVVVMGVVQAGDQVPTMPVENAGVFEGVFVEVAQSKSHEGQQALEFAGELDAGAAD